MVNILIFSKSNLENGRGGEVFFIELATGLQKYYNIDLLETNILFGKKYLTKEEIKKRMPRIKRKPQLKFAQFKIFDCAFFMTYFFIRKSRYYTPFRFVFYIVQFQFAYIAILLIHHSAYLND